MKLLAEHRLIIYFIVLLLYCDRLLAANSTKRLVCYYDAESSIRPGFAQMRISDLESASDFCTHLVYGYAGVKKETYDIASLDVDLDMYHFKEVLRLKAKKPQLKIYLSVGCDHDKEDEEDTFKYIQLLEAGEMAYRNFANSSIELLRSIGFDGLDIAFQFPRNKPRKVHSELGLLWKKFKKLFTGNFIVDPEANEHKLQFTKFTEVLATEYSRTNLSLTLTVLPNVNSSWYFDIPVIQKTFEFINLFAFDFLTPQRNPEEADYTSPIYYLNESNRLQHYCIAYQVSHWLDSECPSSKLNLGIATYGQAWKMSIDSGLNGQPVVPATKGPAEPGLQSAKAGLLSWPEICAKLSNGDHKADYRGPKAPLNKVTDLDGLYGDYAYRPADSNDEHGLWISFDDPDFAGIKATYARAEMLGGVALYDLSYDDFRGLCTGTRYPILRSIHHRL